MKRLVLVLMLTLSGCGLFKVSPPAEAPKPDAPKVDIVSRALDNVVALVQADGSVFCSAVITHNVILTANHCVDHGLPFQAQLYDGTRFDVQVLNAWETQDLAALRPLRSNVGEGVPLSKDMPAYGEPVYVLGHSLGTFTYSLTKGIVSHPRRVGAMNPDVVWFQHDANQVGGNSGGPVLNAYGEVLGIVSFGVMQEVVCDLGCPGVYQDSGVNGAIHLESILAFLDTIRVGK